MHTSAREEANLTDTTDEPKPQPETSETPTSPEPEAGQLETPEQEKTALVPTEPEVIEGEFVEIEPLEPSEEDTPSKQKLYWLLIPFAMLLCLLFLAGSYLLPLLPPSAAVTILPVERGITTTTAIQVHGRLLPALTLSQSITVQATGTMHQNATRASGTITFYNGLLSSQTIASGTVLTGRDAVTVITDQPATIPAANPPLEGHITVSAHAVSVGAQGNIPAYDINQACYATSVLAKNTTAFTGGTPARDVIIVTKHDLETATRAIKTIILKSEQAVLNAQVNPSEAVIILPCKPSVTSNHKPGDEATQVTVTVSETCSGIAYAAHDVDQDATQMIAGETAKRFGTGYSLRGEIQISVIHATITNQARGIATLSVKLDATYVYHISSGETQQLVQRIAGKTKQQAVALLLQLPGIQAVRITSTAATLPQDPGSITIHIQYIAV
jgi:hypothetical protein